MTKKLQQVKGRKAGYTFASKPHNIFRADVKNNTPSPASVLSNTAFRLLDNLVAQYNGTNNGDLSAAFKIMKLYGWTSKGSVSGGLLELLEHGFIEQTRQGGRNQCSLYALTWHGIDECGGKLDVNPTNVPSNLWKPENKEKIDKKYVSKLKTVPAMRGNVPAIRGNDSDSYPL
jgi:hypothetical protein